MAHRRVDARHARPPSCRGGYDADHIDFCAVRASPKGNEKLVVLRGAENGADSGSDLPRVYRSGRRVAGKGKDIVGRPPRASAASVLSR